MSSPLHSWLTSNVLAAEGEGARHVLGVSWNQVDEVAGGQQRHVARLKTRNHVSRMD